MTSVVSSICVTFAACCHWRQHHADCITTLAGLRVWPLFFFFFFFFFFFSHRIHFGGRERGPSHSRGKQPVLVGRVLGVASLAAASKADIFNKLAKEQQLHQDGEGVEAALEDHRGGAPRAGPAPGERQW